MDTYEYVLGLALRYNAEDLEHAQQDAYLATKLFRLTRRLHELPQECEEYLGYAALLHDIGYFYGYDGHHKHAYRMIMAAQIPGLDEREKRIVALTARYHRSARPKKKHKGYRDLSPEDQDVVRKLGSILRFADGLDRGHANAVQDLDVEVTGSHVIVTLYPDHSNELERWAGLKKSRFFQDVMGVSVEIR